MKNILPASIIFIFFLLFSSQALAQNPGQKLKRGVVNILTAPIEIPKQTRIYWKKGAQKTDHVLVWIFSGFIDGTIQMAQRILSGTWDILSFPVNLPKDYAPLKKPDTVFSP
ncbi:MAG: hypothetical protein WC552_05815 [Candidatus Omnitrophota bacterium]